jgi:hypothetical protein
MKHPWSFGKEVAECIKSREKREYVYDYNKAWEY